MCNFFKYGQYLPSLPLSPHHYHYAPLLLLSPIITTIPNHYHYPQSLPVSPIITSISHYYQYSIFLILFPIFIHIPIITSILQYCEYPLFNSICAITKGVKCMPSLCYLSARVGIYFRPWIDNLRETLLRIECNTYWSPVLANLTRWTIYSSVSFNALATFRTCRSW